MTAEGTPTANTAEMLDRSASPTRGLKVTTAPLPLLSTTTIKYAQATQFEMQVATPAPSRPRMGRMKSPMARAKSAAMDRPR